MLLATIAHIKRIASDRYVRHWQALSIIFLYLCLDEALSIHDGKFLLYLRSALNTSGFFYFAWVIPGIILVIICLLAFLGFLTHLPAKFRRLFLMAGTIYVAGAIGMEMLNGYYANFYGQQDIVYAILTTIEELLEMLGIIVFIYALLSYMSFHVKELRAYMIDDRKQRRSC